MQKVAFENAIHAMENDLQNNVSEEMTGFTAEEIAEAKKAIIKEYLEHGFENFENWNLNKIRQEEEDCHSDCYYRDFINKLEMDFKVKEMLQRIKGLCIKIKNVTIHIGKVILNGLIRLARILPNTIACLAFGFFLALIVSSVPLIGHFLAPLTIPVLTVAGGIYGFMLDTQTNTIVSRLQAARAGMNQTRLGQGK